MNDLTVFKRKLQIFFPVKLCLFAGRCFIKDMRPVVFSDPSSFVVEIVSQRVVITRQFVLAILMGEEQPKSLVRDMS